MSKGRRRRDGRGPHGLLRVDKPVGPTSHAVLHAVQRTLDAGRAGHAGTLDPAASGLLLVLLGEATKFSAWVMGHDKRYLARVRLGTATDTLDATGEVTAVEALPPAGVESEAAAAALRGLVGEQDQVPPRYSAIKRDGRSLMSRARAGEDFEPPVRRVVCHALELVEADGADLLVRVHCGAGYYVRSFARDLGASLGLPAHLAGLRREAVGPWRVDDAVPPDEATPAAVVPLARAVPEVLSVTLDAAGAEAVGHGRPVPIEGPGADRALLLGPDGAALAMAVPTGDGRWRVIRGLRTELRD